MDGYRVTDGTGRTGDTAKGLKKVRSGAPILEPPQNSILVLSGGTRDRLQLSLVNIAMTRCLTLKYRLAPPKAQRTALQTTLDSCRWVYNKLLETRKIAWKDHRIALSYYDTKKMLPGWKSDHPFLTQAYSQTLQDVVKRVDLAFKSFFRRVQSSEKTAGYPRYKGKGQYDSFTFPQCESGWKLKADRLHLFKVGAVRIKLHRPITGTIKTLTIRRDRLGNWYACFCVEFAPSVPPPSVRRIGIEIGLETLATFSNGECIAYPTLFQKDAIALAKAKSKRDKLPKGDRQRVQAQRTIQHIYTRLANRRKDFVHKLSRFLVNTFEDITFAYIHNLLMTHPPHSKRDVREVVCHQLVTSTIYKAERANRKVAVLPVDGANGCQTKSNCPKPWLAEIAGLDGSDSYLERNGVLTMLARGLAGIGFDP